MNRKRTNRIVAIFNIISIATFYIFAFSASYLMSKYYDRRKWWKINLSMGTCFFDIEILSQKIQLDKSWIFWFSGFYFRTHAFELNYTLDFFEFLFSIVSRAVIDIL